MAGSPQQTSPVSQATAAWAIQCRAESPHLAQSLPSHVTDTRDLWLWVLKVSYVHHSFFERPSLCAQCPVHQIFAPHLLPPLQTAIHDSRPTQRSPLVLHAPRALNGPSLALTDAPNALCPYLRHDTLSMESCSLQGEFSTAVTAPPPGALQSVGLARISLSLCLSVHSTDCGTQWGFKEGGSVAKRLGEGFWSQSIRSPWGMLLNLSVPMSSSIERERSSNLLELLGGINGEDACVCSVNMSYQHATNIQEAFSEVCGLVPTLLEESLAPSCVCQSPEVTKGTFETGPVTCQLLLGPASSTGLTPNRLMLNTRACRAHFTEISIRNHALMISVA